MPWYWTGVYRHSLPFAMGAISDSQLIVPGPTDGYCKRQAPSISGFTSAPAAAGDEVTSTAGTLQSWNETCTRTTPLNKLPKRTLREWPTIKIEDVNSGGLSIEILKRRKPSELGKLMQGKMIIHIGAVKYCATNSTLCLLQLFGSDGLWHHYSDSDQSNAEPQNKRRSQLAGMSVKGQDADPLVEYSYLRSDQQPSSAGLTEQGATTGEVAPKSPSPQKPDDSEGELSDATTVSPSD